MVAGTRIDRTPPARGADGGWNGLFEDRSCGRFAAGVAGGGLLEHALLVDEHAPRAAAGRAERPGGDERAAASGDAGAQRPGCAQPSGQLTSKQIWHIRHERALADWEAMSSTEKDAWMDSELAKREQRNVRRMLRRHRLRNFVRNWQNGIVRVLD